MNKKIFLVLVVGFLLSLSNSVLYSVQTFTETSDADWGDGGFNLVRSSGTGVLANLSLDWRGTGKDGSVVVGVPENINTDVLSGGRTFPDGVNYSVTGVYVSSVTCSSVPFGIVASDEIILINLQGCTTDYGNVGNYEFLRVKEVDGKNLILISDIQRVYGSTHTDLRSDLSNQKISIQRVPNWNNVNVNNDFFCSEWDGEKSGLVVFRAAGTVTIGGSGSIDVSWKGYRGGGSSVPGLFGGQNGESFDGYSGKGGERTQLGSSGGGTGAGNGSATLGGSRGGGGGGGYADSGVDDGGGGGGGGGYAGGGGGAGAGDDNGTDGGVGGTGGSTLVSAGGGGGANNGSGGNAGSKGIGSNGGLAGNGALTGGGGGGNSGGIGGGGGGGGGGLYGSPDVTKLFFGSGGGAGSTGGSGDNYSEGGSGGGIILIYSNSISNIGSILSNGDNGSSSLLLNAGGGSGSGGSIYLIAGTITAGSINSVGGPVSPSSLFAGGGGGGGVGRIRLDCSSLSGSTNPAYFSGKFPSGFQTYPCSYKSNVIDTGSADTRISTVSWSPVSQIAETSIFVLFRASNTLFGINDEVPVWVEVSNNADVNLSGRYVQYFATFTTLNSSLTPVIEDVTIKYYQKPDGVSWGGLFVSSVTVIWNDTTNNPTGTKYTVQLSTGGDWTGSIYSSETIKGNNSAIINTLLPNTTYYARLIAGNITGNLAVINLNSWNSTLCSVPNPYFGDVFTSSITVRWNESSPDNPFNSNYTVQLSTANDFTATIYSSSSIRSDSDGVIVSGLSEDTTYYARVSVRNWEGAGSTVSVSGCKTTLSNAIQPVWSSIGISGVSISWEKFTHSEQPDMECKVELSSANFVEGANIYSSTTVSGVYTSTITSLIPNTTYFARVIVQKYGNVYSTTTLSPGWKSTLCSAPNPYWSDVFTTSITVRWKESVPDNPSDTNYTVQLSTTAGFTTALYSSSSIRSDSDGVTVSGLPDNTTYYGRILARNWDNIDTIVNVFETVTSTSIPPAIIGNLTAIDKPSDAGGCVVVSWVYTEPANVSSYLIYYAFNIFSDTKSAIGVVKDIPKGTKTYELTGLSADTKYYVCVIAKDNTGNMLYENLISTGPVWAANNKVGSNGDWTIEAGFNSEVKVKVTPNTNVDKMINIIKVDPAKKTVVDTADIYAKREYVINNTIFDNLNDTACEFKISDGSALLSPVQIVLSYKGVDVRSDLEDALRIFHLNEVRARWEIVGGAQQLDKIAKTVTATVSSFSVYRIFAKSSAKDLSEVFVYPNPYKEGDSRYGGVEGKNIVFKRLTAKANIKIFNIAGELVFEGNKDSVIEDEYKWETVNNGGEKVARGMYIYLVTNPENGKKVRGRLGIIR
ncbi:MAG: fibronectin type III domain-containing protein [Elusimicrobia bacterium]|nr:fibronectin type III domain-containing protein [Elusimicrobiota bacterium]